ncbi:MAG: delta-60 repeat domain-containing protein, partial [Candidatus Babeliales bacterium]
VDTSCLKWCKANMNCYHGVCDSACNGDNLYLGCIAKQNGIHGFNVSGGGKVMRECVASQNTRDGFNLSTSLLADGDLDNTFGSGGLVTTSGGNRVTGVVIQKDSKIVAAGLSFGRFGLARYNVNGSLDLSFGVGGVVITDFGGTSAGANSVAIQKDGKIVAVGSANIGGTTDFALARYNIDGSLDITFNPTGSLPGTVVTNFGGTSGSARAVAIQKDGKIVAAGQSNVSGTFDFALARYNTDGSLDSTFGFGGLVITDLGDFDEINAVVIQKDGKIITAGRSNVSGTFDFALARYNTDGSLDMTFNPTGSLPGTVTTSFGSTSEANGIRTQKDGKIVVAGTSGTDFALARYNTDGSLDSTFNSAGSLPGTVTTDFGGIDIANAVAIQKDGKIVAAGNSGTDFALARYNTEGSLDTTFNPTGSLPGTVTTDFGDSDAAFAVAIQKEGKIIVAGNSNIDFALAQYVVFKQGVAVRDCVAEENGEDGFNIAGQAYDVRDSSAIHNVAYGFLLESLTDNCQLLSNAAIGNSGIGIENHGNNNQIFNSRALNNVVNNYSGVALTADPTLSAVDYWVNIEI